MGLTPYGFGTPEPGDENLGKPTVDPTTLKSTGIRLIQKGDYVYQNGRPVGMSRAQQEVLLATSTDRGTSSVRSLGNTLKTIDRVTESFERLCEATMREALSGSVSRGVIQIKSITVVKSENKPAYIRISWFDVESQIDRTSVVT